jgi:ParB family protein of integrating conjugative element (PFGI_1 class)
MARKGNDIGELARALKAPSFKNSDARPDLASLDPVSPTTLILPVSEIKAYEHNPRVAENREYPRLKDSIRTRRGLTTPLTVTKRPGDTAYTIAAGGNSRLKALKELAAETGDDAFTHVMCRFEPWDSECQVFANHLIENDVRGTMTFGDKARAVVEWQRLYEESHPDGPPLTQRELVKRLSDAGYRLHQPMIPPLLNTARWLLPHLPALFGSGLGRPAAERLVRLRSCAAQYWQDHLARANECLPSFSFDELFAQVCAERDCHCADWDVELFQSALTIQMAKTLGLDHKLVALDIDSLYHGYSSDCSHSTSSDDSVHSGHADDSSDSGAVPEPSHPAPVKDPQGLTSEWAFERSREIDAIKRQRARARIEANQLSPRESAPESWPTHDNDASTQSERAQLDPGQLRESNYLAAQELAAGHELDQFVKPVDTGFGFFVEAPEPSMVSPEAKDRATRPGQGLALNGVRSGLWWLLCLTADQLASSHLAVLGQSYPASWLIELFTELPKQRPETDALTMLHILVGEPTAHGLVVDALTAPALTDGDASALDRLLRGCRALRANAATGSLALWDTPQ